MSQVTSRQSVGRCDTASVGRIYPARDPSRSRVVVARASSRDGRRGMSSETNGAKNSIHPTSSLERRPMSSLDARHRATRTDRPSSGWLLRRGHRWDGWNATTRAVARRTLAEALAEREVVKMVDMCCGAGARACVCAGRGGGTRSNGASSVARRARARGRAVVVFSIVWMGLTVRSRGV